MPTRVGSYIGFSCLIACMCLYKFYDTFDSRQLATVEEWVYVAFNNMLCGLVCAGVYTYTSTGIFSFLEEGKVPTCVQILCISWTFVVFLGSIAFSWPFLLVSWPLLFFSPKLAALLWVFE